jgi:hypothetical protein
MMVATKARRRFHVARDFFVLIKTLKAKRRPSGHSTYPLMVYTRAM